MSITSRGNARRFTSSPPHTDRRALDEQHFFEPRCISRHQNTSHRVPGRPRFIVTAIRLASGARDRWATVEDPARQLRIGVHPHADGHDADMQTFALDQAEKPRRQIRIPTSVERQGDQRTCTVTVLDLDGTDSRWCQLPAWAHNRRRLADG